LVEHDLAKVGVASSSLVSRSDKTNIVGLSHTFLFLAGLFMQPESITCPGGGIGRHAGLKILWLVIVVRVQVPPGVLSNFGSRRILG
jgi:hypothetical protein